MSLSGVPKDWRKIVQGARKEGWAIYINGAGKLEWHGPQGQRFATACTPTMNGRTQQNYRALMRREGVPGA